MLKFKYRIYFVANFVREEIKMRIDLLHNRIVADCISPRFKECFENILVPMLSDFNPEIEGVLMYEDYLASNLTLEGEWYYPLTVFVADEPRTQWIK